MYKKDEETLTLIKRRRANNEENMQENMHTLHKKPPYIYSLRYYMNQPA